MAWRAAVVASLAAGALGLDECEYWKPCPDQTCTDSNQTGAGNDFVCRCSNGIEQVGGPALCELDECAEPLSGWTASSRDYKKPCGDDQTCSDPNTAANSRLDFVCTCKAGGASAVGTRARCSVNECDPPNFPAGALGPCGNQQCADTNLTARSTSQSALTLGWGDFTCTCATGGASRVGGPANCSTLTGASECVASACGADQSCTDPSDASGDFICTCDSPYIGSAVGKAADCHIDDCWQGSEKVCGPGQYCLDTVTQQAHTNKFTHNFTCYCLSPMYSYAQGVAAPCQLDDCDRPGMDCGTAKGQKCYDKFSTHSDKVGEYVCFCPNGVEAINRPANCTVTETCPDEKVKECAEAGDVCIDNDTRGDQIGVWRCAPAPPVDEDDDSSLPWWVIAVCALALVCCIAFLAALYYKYRQQQQRGKFGQKDTSPPASPGNKSTSEMKTPYHQVGKTPAHAQGQFLTVPGAPPPRKQPLTPPEAGATSVAGAGAIAGAIAAQRARARPPRQARQPAALPTATSGSPGITITCKPAEEASQPSSHGSSRHLRRPGAATSPTTSPTGGAQGPGFGSSGRRGDPRLEPSGRGSSEKPLYQL